MAWYEVVPHRFGVVGPLHDIICHYENDEPDDSLNIVEVETPADLEDALIYAAAFPMCNFFYTEMEKLARAHRMLDDAIEYETFNQYNVGVARKLLADTLAKMDEMILIMEKGQTKDNDF